jgi:hypothetical protein
LFGKIFIRKLNAPLTIMMKPECNQSDTSPFTVDPDDDHSLGSDDHDTFPGLGESKHHEKGVLSTDDHPIGMEESKLVYRSKVFVFLFLLFMGGTVGACTYFYTKKDDVDYFHDAVRTSISVIVRAFHLAYFKTVTTATHHMRFLRYSFAALPTTLWWLPMETLKRRFQW